jgi:ubiquinone/menaquinone biosynthesis C-methylase UbiE
MNAPDKAQRIYDVLWRIYRRPQPPPLPQAAANLPWDDPDFSQRMLREHLDQSHGAASRQGPEISRQVDWLWDRLSLHEGAHVLDVTCGPGLYAVELARRGCLVSGIDFSPASIAYARDLAAGAGLSHRCSFELRDVRTMHVPRDSFDAALFLYGQLAVFTPDEAADLLGRCARALHPAGRLVVELLDPEHIDKTSSTWWYTDDSGLWGDFPFLHLGERHWYAEQNLSLEQFHILNLETGELHDYTLTDQAYSSETMQAMLRQAGFGSVEVYPAWGGLPLYDAEEWIAYLAQK